VGFFADLFNVPMSDKDFIRTHALFATQVDPKRRRRLKTMKPPWGLCVHTTGRGIVKKANKKGTRPIDEAVAYYATTLGPHYAIGYGGAVYQLQADDRHGAHVGISAKERRQYLNGSWVNWKHVVPRPQRGHVLDTALVIVSDNEERWRTRWPDFKSPQHLYPTRSPNACYVSIELVPLLTSHPYVQETGLWYTPRQHAMVAILAADIARRYKWPDKWWETPRLVGHEDLDAMARWGHGGGWDPGALRDSSRFDWSRVTSILAKLA